MAHLTMEFFTKGLVPITSLSFSYEKGHTNLYSFWVKIINKSGSNVIQRLEANRKDLIIKIIDIEGDFK